MESESESQISVDWLTIYEFGIIAKIKKSTDGIDAKAREMIRYNAYLKYKNIYKFVDTTQDICRRLSPHQNISLLR